MNEAEFSSDSSDDDYIPEGVSASEEDESGEDEKFLLLNNEENMNKDKMENLKRKKISKVKARKRSRPNAPEQVVSENQSESFEIPRKVETDKLWEDFLKDTSSARPTSKANVETQKIKVVKEYNFAGETIKVEDEIDINSKKAKSSSEFIPNDSNNMTTIPTKPNILPSLNTQSHKKIGGLSSVLDKINKKPKINILEKSKLDWQSFTKAEGIQEDLKKHNIGKQGYLERMSFLQRTDQKQFEIERNFRLANKKPS